MRVLALVCLLFLQTSGLAHGATAALPGSDPRLLGARPAFDPRTPPWRRERPTIPAPELVPPQAVYDDNLWSDEFALPSCDGFIECAVRYGDDLIVAGYFRQIGGVLANNVARWDGTAWHAMGSLGSEVHSLAIYEGDLIASGSFQYADGDVALHVAKWDGSRWRSVIPISPYLCCYDITSLTQFRSDLILAGSFGDPQFTPLRGIARWSGSGFMQPLGGGVHGYINTVLAVGDSLFVAGTFDSVGTVAANNIAMWDGSNWSALGAGIRSGWYVSVRALAWFHDRLYAGGEFDSAGTSAASAIASWNGSDWQVLEGMTNYWVSSLAVHNDTLAVGTYPSVAHWDGNEWTDALPGRTNPTALLSDPSGLIALGIEFDDDLSRPLAFDIARWDGSAWAGYEGWRPDMHGLSSYAGTAASVSCLASFQGSLVAGGQIAYTRDGSGWKRVGPITRWDGSGWEEMPSLEYVNPAALLALSDTLYEAGSNVSFNFPDPYRETPVLRWASSYWTPLDTLTARGTCLASYHGQLFVGTAVAYPVSAPPGVYRWNGTKLVPVGVLDHQGAIEAMATYDNRLVVGGSFDSIAGIAANGIAVWDGAAWRTLGPPTPPPPYGGSSEVRGLLVHDGALLALRAGGLYSWGGDRWNAFPGLRGSVSSMLSARGRLFVSGSFRLNNSNEASNMAVWNGSSWSSMGSGTAPYGASALAYHDGAIYAGGGFDWAGGKSSFGIARWNGLAYASSLRPTLAPGVPNPFRGATDFSFRTERPGIVRISVKDVQGREVILLEQNYEPAGLHSVRWDGRDRLGKPAAAGIYFLHLRDPDGTEVTRKIVRLR